MSDASIHRSGDLSQALAHIEADIERREASCSELEARIEIEKATLADEQAGLSQALSVRAALLKLLDGCAMPVSRPDKPLRTERSATVQDAEAGNASDQVLLLIKRHGPEGAPTGVIFAEAQRNGIQITDSGLRSVLSTKRQKGALFKRGRNFIHPCFIKSN